MRSQKNYLQAVTESCVLDDALGLENLPEDIIKNSLQNPGQLALAVDKAREVIRSTDSDKVQERLDKIENFASRLVSLDYSTNYSEGVNSTAFPHIVSKPPRRRGAMLNFDS